MIEWVVAGGVTAAIGAAMHGIYEPNSRVFGRAVSHGTDPRAVYLTFDDGPNPGVTDRILETLAKTSVPAAFFQVGRYVEQHAALARDVLAAGHEIGNHTWTHRKLHRLGPASVDDELLRTDRILRDTVGVTPRSFRAPHGYRTPFVTRTARTLDYTVFGWSFGVWDTALPGAEVIRARIRKKVRGGSVLLLHDGDGYAMPGDRSQTAEALPGIIADVRNAGLEFRPLSELMP